MIKLHGVVMRVEGGKEGCRMLSKIKENEKIKKMENGKCVLRQR